MRIEYEAFEMNTLQGRKLTYIKDFRLCSTSWCHSQADLYHYAHEHNLSLLSTDIILSIPFLHDIHIDL